MASQKFEIEPYDGADKEIRIMSDVGIRILVDHDDVEHRVAERLAKRIANLPVLEAELKALKAKQ